MNEIEYFHLLATAAIKTNLAKRIMFSLLPKLLESGAQVQSYHTGGAIDYKTLKQMLPIAKELLHYSLQAAEDEATKWYQPNDDQPDAESLLTGKSDPEKLQILSRLFRHTDNWADQFGGEAWGKITDILIKVQHHISEAEKNARNYDEPEKFYQELMQVVAYMNVIDGLAHNTGSIMDKLITLESIENPELYGGEIPTDISDIERMMDAKELNNEQDVLAEIYPTLEQSDAPLVMKDWMSKARQQRHEFNTPEAIKRRETQLQAIRNKKIRTEELETRKKNLHFKDWLSIINQSDNRILDFVISQTFIADLKSLLRFASMSFLGNIPQSVEVRTNMRDIESSLRSLKDNGNNYYDARKVLSKSIELIETIGRKIEEDFDNSMLNSN